LSLIDAQTTLTSFTTATGFNMSATTDIGVNNKFYLSYNFVATDTLTSPYSLKLVSIFEATNQNGKLTQAPGTVLPMANYQPVLPVPPVMTNPMSSNMTLTFGAKQQNPIMDPLQNLIFNHVFWLPPSGKNVCPDANGRYCLKVKQSFSYTPRVQGSSLVFQWQLFENQVMGNALNILPTQNQVLNNLAFYSVENIAIVTDAQGNTFPIQPVTLQLRTDNVTTNGIWVIYNFPASLAVPFAVLHDPVVGVNIAPPALSIQIVTAALSAAVVLVFIVILSCSIYIYHGNTKDYYIKLRIRQELQ
jgi:hypothetical protein